MMTRGRILGLAAAGAIALVLAAASAGECPADQTVASDKGQQPGATMPKDVTDTVLGTIALAEEPVAIRDRELRLRRLVIQPGGEVPFHSHADRPAIIYIVAGTVTEYSTDCAVPIVHKAGEVSVETHGVAHWWRNTGSEPAELISADLLHAADDAEMM